MEQTKKILEVPYIDQSVRYPTGCESVSTVMMLQYLGYEMDVDDFIEQYLPCEPFEEREGVLYGPNPRVSFCGSPYDEESFGCYAPVIQKTLEQIVGADYEVVDETGTPTSQLLAQYIDQGMPVVYWACINMREPIVGPDWMLKDTKEKFTWISNEHCMLLVGYDEDGYYFNDPQENHGLIKYPKEVVEHRHAAQYEQAVALRRKNLT
jgi:uncharacterized protein YvpB